MKPIIKYTLQALFLIGLQLSIFYISIDLVNTDLLFNFTSSLLGFILNVLLVAFVLFNFVFTIAFYDMNIKKQSKNITKVESSKKDGKRELELGIIKLYANLNSIKDITRNEGIKKLIDISIRDFNKKITRRNNG